jgi:uncharacterized SAM-binding protein YcdF (DUF218 family)
MGQSDRNLSSGSSWLSTALRFFRNVLLASGALLLAVTFTPLVPWAARPLATPWTDVNHGVLIILSGSTVTYSDPAAKLMIGLNTYWRVVHAIYAWRNGRFQTILVSGDGTGETVKPLLIANGIPESAIVVEGRATNTRENAAFSKPILAGLPGPYVLVTSDYQMFRASRCFAHEGITVETLPAPDLFKRCNIRLERWDAFYQLLAEVSSIAYYRVHGWI